MLEGATRVLHLRDGRTEPEQSTTIP
jgi:hypothetical protein